MSRHYIPVAAKREALRLYRHRATRGMPTITNDRVRYLSRVVAMRSVVDFYAGHLAVRLSHDNAIPQDLLDCYRAAEHYLARMYGKPWRLHWIDDSGVSGPPTTRRGDDRKVCAYSAIPSERHESDEQPPSVLARESAPALV